MITDVLHRLANHRQSLSRAEAREAMAERRPLGLERPLGPLIDHEEHDKPWLGAGLRCVRHARRRARAGCQGRGEGGGEDDGVVHGARHERRTIPRGPNRAGESSTNARPAKRRSRAAQRLTRRSQIGEDGAKETP